MGGQTALDQVSTKSGKFERKASTFRDFVEEGGKFPPASGRYHLYVSKACPWATRTLQFLALKGLEGAIEVHSVHPTWRRTKPELDEHCGWHFVDAEARSFVDDTGKSFSTQGCTADGLNGCKTMRDLYDLAVKGEWTKSSFTTPVLWCSEEKTIVNNESSEICRMLNSSFNAIATNPGLDLYPSHLSERVAELEPFIYDKINNGVYKCGFATTQEAYDEAVEALFAALDVVEELLDRSRFLCGAEITGIDIWLFNTLVRFDPVYYIYFKCSKKSIMLEYPNLSNYVRDLYQVKEIGKTIDLWNIRTHYFTSHRKLNPYAIVPSMPDRVDLDAPHDRGSRTYAQ